MNYRLLILDNLLQHLEWFKARNKTEQFIMWSLRMRGHRKLFGDRENYLYNRGDLGDSLKH